MAGTIEEVQAVLGDAQALLAGGRRCTWRSRWVQPGGADGIGAVVDLHTKGWLPHTRRWTLHITEPIIDTGFALRATGDLEATNRRTFTHDVRKCRSPTAGASTPLLRRLGWLLKPALSANHTWAIRRGEESLRLESRRQRQGEFGSPHPAPAGGHVRILTTLPSTRRPCDGPR